MNKEHKAKEYADWAHKLVEEFYDRKCAEHDFYYKKADVQLAFEAGWDEALKSQWIKVEEKLPEIEQDVLAIIKYNSKFLIIELKYFGKKDWYMGDYRIIAWMQIPSFDNILEDNKDVLKRLKDR